MRAGVKIHIKSRVNRRTKYWKIAAQKEFVERQRYLYYFHKKSAIRQILHDINIGWKDNVPTKRKQYYI